jgi:hypothetical protein
LVKDSNRLIGLDVRINNQTDSEASKISEKRARNLLNILNIQSGLALTVYSTGAEGVSRTGGLGRTLKDFRVIYNIEG